MKCLVCKSAIEDGASKCVHCNSFQNWRRFLGMSGTILSLLVALISVSAVTIPPVFELFEDKNAYPDVEMIGSLDGTLDHAVLFNSGQKPVIFSGARVLISNLPWSPSLVSEDVEDIRFFVVELSFSMSPEERLLNPGETQVVKLENGAIYSDDADGLTARDYLKQSVNKMGLEYCKIEASFRGLNGAEFRALDFQQCEFINKLDLDLLPRSAKSQVFAPTWNRFTPPENQQSE